MNIIVYDAEGTILRTGYVPDYQTMLMQPDRDQFVMEGEADDSLQYVLNGAVVNKLEISATLVAATLSGLPVPCAIIVERIKYEIMDGIAEVSFNFPGTYQVKVEALHYLSKTYQVTL